MTRSVLSLLCAMLWCGAGIGATAGVAPEPSPARARVALDVTFAGLAIDVHPGYVRVSEVVHLHNGTKQTFTGEVQVALPRGAQFVTFHDGWRRPTLNGRRLRDSLTVRPGTHRLTYAYSVKGDGGVDLEREILMPTALLEVFTLAPAVARGPGLMPSPPVVSEGRTFNRASLRRVPPGPLAVQVVGVPAAGQWPAPAAAAALAAALGLGLVVAVARTKGRASGV